MRSPWTTESWSHPSMGSARRSTAPGTRSAATARVEPASGQVSKNVERARRRIERGEGGAAVAVPVADRPAALAAADLVADTLEVHERTAGDRAACRRLGRRWSRDGGGGRRGRCGGRRGRRRRWRIRLGPGARGRDRRRRRCCSAGSRVRRRFGCDVRTVASQGQECHHSDHNGCARDDERSNTAPGAPSLGSKGRALKPARPSGPSRWRLRSWIAGQVGGRSCLDDGRCERRGIGSTVRCLRRRGPGHTAKAPPRRARGIGGGGLVSLEEMLEQCAEAEYVGRRLERTTGCRRRITEGWKRRIGVAPLRADGTGGSESGQDGLTRWRDGHALRFDASVDHSEAMEVGTGGGQCGEHTGDDGRVDRIALGAVPLRQRLIAARPGGQFGDAVGFGDPDHLGHAGMTKHLEQRRFVAQGGPLLSLGGAPGRQPCVGPAPVLSTSCHDRKNNETTGKDAKGRYSTY